MIKSCAWHEINEYNSDKIVTHECCKQCKNREMKILKNRSSVMEMLFDYDCELDHIDNDNDIWKIIEHENNLKIAVEYETNEADTGGDSSIPNGIEYFDAYIEIYRVKLIINHKKEYETFKDITELIEQDKNGISNLIERIEKELEE